MKTDTDTELEPLRKKLKALVGQPVEFTPVFTLSPPGCAGKQATLVRLSQYFAYLTFKGMDGAWPVRFEEISEKDWLHLVKDECLARLKRDSVNVEELIEEMALTEIQALHDQAARLDVSPDQVRAGTCRALHRLLREREGDPLAEIEKLKALGVPDHMSLADWQAKRDQEKGLSE